MLPQVGQAQTAAAPATAATAPTVTPGIAGVVAALVVGAFALFHGVAHGLELAGEASAWPTLAGMLTATVLLHCAGLAAGWALRQRTVWISRTAGMAVALMGGALLAQMA